MPAMQRMVTLSSLCSLIAGCTQINIAEGGIPTTGPLVAVGVGVTVPADAPGYVITASGGGWYRLVWYSDFPDRIVGSIFTAGHFTRITAGCDGECRSEEGALVPVALAGGGERVDFAAIAEDDAVGFDFVVDAEPVYFDLLVNDARLPEMVRFPSVDGDIASPPSIPFALIGTGVVR